MAQKKVTETKEKPAAKKKAAPKKAATKKVTVKPEVVVEEVVAPSVAEEAVTPEVVAEPAAPETPVVPEKKDERVISKEEEFTDAHPYEAPKVEETKPAPVEEKKPEPAPEPEPTSYEYDDENLSHIEDARKDFFAKYKKDNRIKTIVSVGILLVIVAGWIIPYTIPALKSSNWGLVTSLIVVGVCIVALGIYSAFFRKKSDKGIKDYFIKYYESTYKFVLKGLGVKNFQGNIDNKITEDEFNQNRLYGNTYKVGSRYGVTFNYQGMEVSLTDAASQQKGKKALETTFVGKYMRTPNAYTGAGLIIYFKGNDRALPPSNLLPEKLLEETDKMVIYGEKEDKKFLNHKIRTALSKIRTDKTLVDVAISIQPGTTHFCLGYEDNLMIIPLQKAFNPAPVNEFKENLSLMLEIALLFYKAV